MNGNNLNVLVPDGSRLSEMVIQRTYEFKGEIYKLKIVFAPLSMLGELLTRQEFDIIIGAENYASLPEATKGEMIGGRAADLMKMLICENDLLEQKKEELNAILNSTSEGIEAADIHGHIKYVNPAFLQITGMDPGERLGRNIFDVNREGVLAQVLRTKEAVPGNLRCGPGSKREVIVTGAPVIKDNSMVGAVVVINDISEAVRLAREVQDKRDILTSLYNRFSQVAYNFNDIVATSKSMREAVALARKAVPSYSTILIIGESGTGKELFAQSIHSESKQGEPFIAVNCASIPGNLLEEELFGHEKGAFTGAGMRKIGLFELAKNGTVFLDEIGDLNLNLQAKLLRVLQQREFRRVGGIEVIPFHARVVSATNHDLQKMIGQGLFREDLYYRLNVITIRVAPLRERKDDLPKLVEILLKKISRRIGKKVERIEQGVLEAIPGYSWPGNVRELENVLERAATICEGDTISNHDIEPYIFNYDPLSSRENEFSLELMERKQIKNSLSYFGNDLKGKQAAAKALGIALTTLYQKLRKYEIS